MVAWSSGIPTATHRSIVGNGVYRVESGQPIVTMRGIHKAFPGVRALRGVDLTINPGEVHGLVGENGAGKSTLIKILMGVYQMDGGEICIDGTPVSIKNPIHATSYGLRAVYQDVNLASHLSVGENFFLGNLPRRNGLIDWNTIHRVAGETLQRLNIRVSTTARIKDLTVAEQEMVTIAKIVHERSRVIVFDEPTALLTNEEVDELFRIIAELKSNGIGIVYISHRMEEIFTVCDRVTVLRDGALVDTTAVAETDHDRLINSMVGRSVDHMYSIEHAGSTGETVLEVCRLGRHGAFREIDFSVHAGEIFGMFGLIGAGRTEILRAIFGADPYDEGVVKIHGRERSISDPRQGIAAGLSLLPENRKEHGLALGLEVVDNVGLASLERNSTAGFMHRTRELQETERYVKELDIRTSSVHAKAGKLSGGNQQKVVIARWLLTDSDVIMFDEPTIGVDVGAKVEIYRLIEALISKGKAVLLVSSYLPEVMGLADRMLVMYEGRGMGIISKSEYSEEMIMKMASGFPLQGAVR